METKTNEAKAQHTPGPWKIGNRYGLNRTEILNKTGGRAIASVWTHDPDRSDESLGKKRDAYIENGEGMANARLIAESPNLLEVLKKSYQWVAKCAADHDSDYLGVRAKKMLIEMENAIDKAEGKL